MPDFNDLTLLPFCVGLTLLGLIASWAAFRRRGAAAGTRGVAWSLLPVSLYLTGLLELVWDVGQSVANWVGHLIFSPSVWAGVALFGVSVVLYVVSGVAQARRGDKAPAAQRRQDKAAGKLTSTGPAPASAQPAEPGKSAKSAKSAKAPQQDDAEFDEIEDILKRHGIN